MKRSIGVLGRYPLCGVAIAVAAFASAVHADGFTPIGPQFPVSSQPRSRAFSCNGVARGANGRFVAAMSAGYGSDAMRYLRLFDAGGTPLFAEDSWGLGAVYHGGLAMDADGDFISIMHSHPQGFRSILYAYSFDASGEKMRSFAINQNTTYGQGSTEVAMHADGHFVVTWEAPDGGNTYPSLDIGVYARLFDASGAALSDEFRVNTGNGGQQTSPDVAMDADGNFTVVWVESSSVRVRGQRYDSAGEPLGTNQFLTESSSVSGSPVKMAMAADGQFVVIWSGHDTGAPTFSQGVHARRFDAQGVPLGSTVRVNTTTGGAQIYPCIAMDADGDYGIVWQSGLEPNANEGEIMGRAYARSGAALGEEVRLSVLAEGVSSYPSIAVDGLGNFVVTWSEELGSVQGRLFGNDASPDPFIFRTRRDAEPLALVRSSPVVPAGFGEAQVLVRGHPTARYSINDGPLTQLPGVVRGGDTLRAAMESPALGGAANQRTMELSVGDQSATFVVQTLVDRIPEAFEFAAATGLEPGRPVTSASLVPTGYTMPLRIAVSGHSSCRLRINTAPMVRRAQISPGQALRLRMVAPDEPASSRTCQVYMGDVVASFTGTSAP